MLAIWSLGSSAFSKSSLNIWKFRVHILLKPGLENFEHYFTSMWDKCNCAVVWTLFGIACLWDWNENWHFSSPVGTAEFSKFAGILSAALSQHHLLGFEIAQLEFITFTNFVCSDAHLTSHSRMYGSRWMITPLWLSGSWRSFLYSSSVNFCHLLIASASVRSMQFLSFIVPIFAWNGPLVYLIFLKNSLVFPLLLFSSVSLHWSLRDPFLSLLAILWNSAFKWVYLSFFPLCFTSLLFTAICKASPDSHFGFLHLFFWWWSWWLPSVQCHEPKSLVHQVFYQIYSLKSSSHFHCIIIRDLS